MFYMKDDSGCIAFKKGQMVMNQSWSKNIGCYRAGKAKQVLSSWMVVHFALKWRQTLHHKLILVTNMVSQVITFLQIFDFFGYFLKIFIVITFI